MDISIYSRQQIEEKLRSGFGQNVAIISFCDPDLQPVDFQDIPRDRIILCKCPDIAYEELEAEGFSYDTFLPEAADIARLVKYAVQKKDSIICQCEYGESRSAGCAAAILEFYENSGIDIFTDYKRMPSQLIYHKVYDALVTLSKERMN